MNSKIIPFVILMLCVQHAKTTQYLLLIRASSSSNISYLYCQPGSRVTNWFEVNANDVRFGNINTTPAKYSNVVYYYRILDHVPTSENPLQFSISSNSFSDVHYLQATTLDEWLDLNSYAGTNSQLDVQLTTWHNALCNIDVLTTKLCLTNSEILFKGLDDYPMENKLLNAVIYDKYNSLIGEIPMYEGIDTSYAYIDDLDPGIIGNYIGQEIYFSYQYRFCNGNAASKILTVDPTKYNRITFLARPLSVDNLNFTAVSPKCFNTSDGYIEVAVKPSPILANTGWLVTV